MLVCGKFCEIKIQIQHLLKLNMVEKGLYLMFLVIQIQHLLKLNNSQERHFASTCEDSNTTLVKVKLRKHGQRSCRM